MLKSRRRAVNASAVDHHTGGVEMARLTGKVALITGAAGGQGSAEAELFAREGAAVVLTDTDTAAGEALARHIEGQGGQALFRHHDVSDEAAWREVVAAALARFGKLHILVNNAGTIARQGIVDTTVEAWNRTLAVNLTGAMLGMKHCAPAIRDSGGGSIVNISSTAGLTAHDDAAYTASKWGLRGLTKTAVLQFSPWNIRVNSIHPGQIADTGFFHSGSEAFAHAARTAIPLHRQGTPQECAELVLFLASDESRFISGAEIAIDGGYIAAGLASLRNIIRADYEAGKN
jgi:3alpha(or 20beta)-hydroxysteroid dehydrogenase